MILVFFLTNFSFLLSHFSATLEKLLEKQKENEWNVFVGDRELIIKYGFVNKRKGLFARKRMLLLTNTPRLIYIDPHTRIKKGEIPFDFSLKAETKNFKIFHVHTVGILKHFAKNFLT